MRLDAKTAAELLADPGLWRDFNDICDCGGRLAGTESEKRAFALLRERVRAASPANSGRSIPVPYGGWRAKTAILRLPDGRKARLPSAGAHHRHAAEWTDCRGDRPRPRHAG